MKDAIEKETKKTKREGRRGKMTWCGADRTKKVRLWNRAGGRRGGVEVLRRIGLGDGMAKDAKARRVGCMGWRERKDEREELRNRVCG